MRKKEIRFLQDSLSACCLFFSSAAGNSLVAYLSIRKGDVSYEKLQEYVQEPEEEESPESEERKGGT